MAYRLLAGLFMILLAMQGVSVIASGGAHPGGPVRLATSASGWDGIDLPVSRDVVEASLSKAQGAMTKRATAATQYRVGAQCLSMLAFALGAVVTFVAGILGKPAANAADVQALQADLARRRRLSAAVGGLAALSTIATGAGAKAGEFGEVTRKAALEMRDRIVAANRDLGVAKSPADVNAVLATLDLESSL